MFFHCNDHDKYKSYCKKCRDQTDRNEKTHYKNGIEKPKGIYSDENWARFNALGAKLTNERKK